MTLARCRVPLAAVCLLLGDASAVAADVTVAASSELTGGTSASGGQAKLAAVSMALLRSRRQR